VNQNLDETIEKRTEVALKTIDEPAQNSPNCDCLSKGKTDEYENG